MIDFTTTANIANIKRNGIFPDAQTLFLASDIVDMMSDAMRSMIVPLLIQLKQEYLVSVYDSAIAQGATAAFINSRAVGGKLRDCVLVDSGGQEIPLHRYEPEDLKEGFQRGSNRGFYVDNDRVIFLPQGDDLSAYTLRQRIYRRPNNLVQVSSAARVTAINTATKTVTCASIPSAFTTSLVYDIIKGQPSFRSHGEDLVVTAILGFDITFSATLPTDLAVGDWIAEAGFSPIAQIPYDLHPLLDQSTLIAVLDGLKDKGGKDMAQETYKEMVDTYAKLVNPRVDGAPQKIVSRRGIGAFIRGAGWRS
jgi:hypothetical protein